MDSPAAAGTAGGNRLTTPAAAETRRTSRRLWDAGRVDIAVLLEARQAQEGLRSDQRRSRFAPTGATRVLACAGRHKSVQVQQAGEARAMCAQPASARPT